MTDVLGSTLGLTDVNGAAQAQYTFEPYGTTLTSGALVVNAAQFTGRENDNTSLYYYRARYYNPQLARFVSEDRLGFVDGANLSEYAGGNPVLFRDPLGFDKECRKPPFPPGASPETNTRRAEGVRDSGLEPLGADEGAHFQEPLWWFFFQVKPGGPMDYKAVGPPRFYEPAGNFNYGAVGGALGLSLDELLIGAGAAQTVFGPRDPKHFGYPWTGPPYGDDPNDQDWIRRGFDWFKKCQQNSH